GPTPGLPEGETTRRGLAPHLPGRRIESVTVRNAQLRWPVAADLASHITGQQVRALRRRAKYLILELERDALIVHLGMSGALRVVAADAPAGKHDHFELLLDDRMALRLTDPRRFGSIHRVRGAPEAHVLLANL